MEKRAASTSVTLGATGETFRENVKRTRAALGWTLRDLSERLGENGYPIAQSALSKLENGTRRVDVDDAIALAVALGVSPLTLLLPSPPDPRAEVAVSGWGSERAYDLWHWAVSGEGLVSASDRAERMPWWLEVTARFALGNVRPASEEPRKGAITRTVTTTLDDDDPRIPFVVDGETLDHDGER